MTKKLEELLNLPHVAETFKKVDEKEKTRESKDRTVGKNLDPKTQEALKKTYEEFDKISDIGHRAYGKKLKAWYRPHSVLTHPDNLVMAKIHSNAEGTASIRWNVERVREWCLGEIATNVDTKFYQGKFENVDDSKFGDLNPGIAGVE